jgi:hypothetical protein
MQNPSKFVVESQNSSEAIDIDNLNIEFLKMTPIQDQEEGYDFEQSSECKIISAK